MLALILVKPFNLNVKDRINVKLNARGFVNMRSERLFVFKLYFAEPF